MAENGGAQNTLAILANPKKACKYRLGLQNGFAVANACLPRGEGAQPNAQTRKHCSACGPSTRQWHQPSQETFPKSWLPPGKECGVATWLL